MPDLGGLLEEQQERAAISDLAARVFGIRVKRLGLTVADGRQIGREADVFRLPIDDTYAEPLMNPDGSRRSMFGVDHLGSGFTF